MVSIASRSRKSGGKLRSPNFFFDEAVAKTFWPGSADSAAETSCSCLDSLHGNVAGAVVSVASRSRKSGGKFRTPNFFFDEAVAKTFWPGSADSAAEASAAALTAYIATLPAPWFPLPPGPENQGENCGRHFFDEAVAKIFWPRSADSAAEASCSCLDDLRGNVAGAVVSIASRSRKSGGKLRTPNFFF